MNLLEQLKRVTTVVADTGDIQSIERLRPVDATTNPSLITQAAKMPAYEELVGSVLTETARRAKGASNAEIVAEAIDALSVEFGRRILELIPGRVSTEVDARLSYDRDRTLEKARKLIGLYAAHGVAKERVLIKIAATWEGIAAAEILEREGIHCNLTLLFGYHQAMRCAEAKVTLISPFVGRILDYYLKESGRESYAPEEDPGVLSVTKIYRAYKQLGHKTEVMGASFRNLGEIIELAGCDLLTIAPKFLEELAQKEGVLVRKLSPEAPIDPAIVPIDVSEANFRRLHEADAMSSFKLNEGIVGFSKALVELEGLLLGRL